MVGFLLSIDTEILLFNNYVVNSPTLWSVTVKKRRYVKISINPLWMGVGVGYNGRNHFCVSSASRSPNGSASGWFITLEVIN